VVIVFPLVAVASATAVFPVPGAAGATIATVWPSKSRGA
jgi:hypothetical protein